MTWKAYFIGCKVGDRVSPYIKIGRGDVESRLSTLQIGCPYQLAILGVTNEYTELHLRVRGEWFKIDKELQRLIFNFPYEPPQSL